MNKSVRTLNGVSRFASANFLTEKWLRSMPNRPLAQTQIDALCGGISDSSLTREAICTTACFNPSGTGANDPSARKASNANPKSVSVFSLFEFEFDSSSSTSAATHSTSLVNLGSMTQSSRAPPWVLHDSDASHFASLVNALEDATLRLFR